MAKMTHMSHPVLPDDTLCGDAISEVDRFVNGEQELPEIGTPITCPRCLRIITACVNAAKQQSASAQKTEGDHEKQE